MGERIRTVKRNRAPSTTWPTHMKPWSPYVRTVVNDLILIVGRPSYDQEGNSLTGVYLTRGEARLLAKRINQCLDATVKK